jgi:hypothetical protein
MVVSRAATVTGWPLPPSPSILSVRLELVRLCLERPAVGVVHPCSGAFFRARMVGAVKRAPEVRGEAGSLENGVQTVSLSQFLGTGTAPVGHSPLGLFVFRIPSRERNPSVDRLLAAAIDGRPTLTKRRFAAAPGQRMRKAGGMPDFSGTSGFGHGRDANAH